MKPTDFLLVYEDFFYWMFLMSNENLNQVIFTLLYPISMKWVGLQPLSWWEMPICTARQVFFSLLKWYQMINVLKPSLQKKVYSTLVGQYMEA